MYFTITTITTVGFGDLSGTNTLEEGYCAVIMIVGVSLFSFANGALASIIQSQDSANADFQEKLVILNRVYKEYFLPLDLFLNLKKTIIYES